MSTIIIGVDASERSEDAIAFGRRIADAGTAKVIVANAYPYSDVPSRAANAGYRNALREHALVTTRNMRDQLEGIPEDRSTIAVMAELSPAKALHHLAETERAALVIVGSTHTGRAGRVLPGSTGERLLHGTPCSVAVVPKDYRRHADAPIRRIGVAYNGTAEAKAAVAAATALAAALDARLELIGVVAPETYTPEAFTGTPNVVAVHEDIERHIQEELDAVAAGLPARVEALTTHRTGAPAEILAERSRELDVLVTGSRGYGPLRSVLIGGVSGALLRSAECPVIVVPRGIEEPLGTLFSAETAAAA